MAKYLTLLQETTPRKSAANIVQSGSSPVVCHVGIPYRHQTNTSLLVVSHQCSHVALLRACFIYVDVNGSHPTVPDVCKNSGDIHHPIYSQNSDTSMG